MSNTFNALNIMCRNGWKWLQYDRDKNESGDEYSQFQAVIYGTSYSSKITAVVSDLPEHLDLDGHYGVLWLDADYECKPPHTYEDLLDMQAAICFAEENLLRIGMPFTEDYRFHGEKKEEKEKKNKELRLLYHLSEKEQADYRN